MIGHKLWRAELGRKQELNREQDLNRGRSCAGAPSLAELTVPAEEPPE